MFKIDTLAAVQDRLFDMNSDMYMSVPQVSTQRSSGIVLSESLRELAKIVSSSPEIPSLIYGETGTGKEEYAKLIHTFRVQGKKDLPFVAVNCANLSGDLGLSALFGHKKGAFTGASQDAAGYLQMAHGGILFLDEVHTLDLNSQQRLLRVLNDGSYQRIGCDRYQFSQFQLISASTKDLDDLSDQGDFLIDLRMRLMGFEIKLPALRERQTEFPDLIRYFFQREGVEIRESVIQDLSAYCRSFYWQGNIRQLFRSLKVLLAHCRGDVSQIKCCNLPIYKSMHRSAAKTFESIHQEDATSVLYPLSHDMELGQALDHYEKTLIHHALLRHQSVNDAVKVLGISRSSFAAKRHKYGLIEGQRAAGGSLQKLGEKGTEPGAL